MSAALVCPTEGCNCQNCRLARTEAKVDLILRLVRKVAARSALNLPDMIEDAEAEK